MKDFPSHPKCQYCETPIPRNLYAEHAIDCSSRPDRIVDKCDYCGKGLMTRRGKYSLRVCSDCNQIAKAGKSNIVQGGLPTLGKRR